MVSPVLFDVLGLVVQPVRARLGDVLVLREGHPARPLVVMRRLRDDWRPVALGTPATVALSALEADGILRRRCGRAD